MLAFLIKYKLAVIAVALLGALGIGGAGVAAANGALPLPGLTHQSATPTPSATATSKPAHHGLASEIVHGSVIVNTNGTWTTYTLDVGSVTSASSSAITLARADGSSATLTVTSSTLWGTKGKTPKDYSRLDGHLVAVLSQNGAAYQVGERDILKSLAFADVTIFHKGAAREVQIERGVVSSVSATQIVLTRADGVTFTGTLATKVRYHQAGTQGPAQASAVTTGATVTLLVSNNQVREVEIAKS